MLSSATTAAASDAQALTLRVFTRLYPLRVHWPGSLILSLGLGPDGAALALAANIAGAVSLTLEPGPALLRNALRAGACDFVVNTLDEALRAMKNEVRKQRPLSVGLEGDPATLLEELAARGVQPELCASLPPSAALTIFQQRGAIILPDTPAPHGWELHTCTLPTSAALKTFDTQALATLPPEDTLRRQWLRAAARLFPRDRTRTLWLTPTEYAVLNQQPATGN